MPIAALAIKIRNFSRHPTFEQLWFLPAWALLGLARALILLVSFRRLAPWLGASSSNRSWVPLLTADEERRALRIGRTVRRAAGYTPWQSNCFPQAVAARVLLGLYGIPYALFFGLMRNADTNAMRAHAWVAAGRIPVTGGVAFDTYTVVGCFVAPRLVEGMHS